MTNSFNPSLGINTSKTNYLQTEVDLTKATNKQIDENVKMMNAHYDRLIKMHNDSIKAQSSNWKDLAAFTKQGMQFAKWARTQTDARNAIQNYYSEDPDAVRSRVLDEAEVNVNEAELKAQKKINYTAAGEIEWLDPDLASALKETGMNRAQIIELLGMSFGQTSEFFERAKDQVEVEVEPGVWKKWTEPGGLTATERSIISKEIDSLFITQLLDSGINRRLINKYLLKPMLNQHGSRLIQAQAEATKGQLAAETERRGKEFANEFNAAANSSTDTTSAGAVIEDYLKTFAGYHAASSGMADKGFVLAKQELQGFIIAGLENGLIEPEVIEGALGYLLSPNDGGPKRTVEEYLPAFATPIRKALTRANNDKLNEAKVALKMEQKNFTDQYINKWRESEESPSEEEVQKAAQEYRAQFGTNSPELSNYWSKQDIDDADIDLELEMRWSKGQEISAEDLDGITSSEMRAKWMTRTTKGGLSSDEISTRDATIKRWVNERTLETDGDKAKTTKWDTIYNNAIDRYNAIYRKEIGLGQDHETAMDVAEKAAIDYIQTDEAAVRTLRARDETKADNINAARASILKDNSVIYSSDFWQGEEPELKAALKYIKNGEGGLPQYYKSFPFINLTPYELMQARLAATGMIKPSEVKPIPERKLPPEQQDLLLNKPSPSRTNRALLEMYDLENEDLEELVNLTTANSVEELIEALRINAERNNKTAGWEISQVNIDPALEEEHTQVVGEQPPFMRLNTMLPGVATAYVEDTYNV